MLGGWQLAIPSSSKNQQAASKLIQYLTSKSVQKWRALNAGYVPTIRALIQDNDVKKQIVHDTILTVNRIMRSSKGIPYSGASKCFYDKIRNFLSTDPRGNNDQEGKERFKKEISGCKLTAKVIGPMMDMQGK